jgi:glycosyltransferase involved in cell wall biosynthesis
MIAPLVTVLIDTYNYGRFIGEAIDSVLSQDFPMEQVEILVVDDGSTDDTAERVKKYGSGISYLHKPNGGQASAFNFGLKRAKGEIVFLLDADDYFLPGKLRRIVEEFGKHPEVGTIYHRLEELDAGSGKTREARFGFVPVSGFLPADRDKLLTYMPHQTSSLAFRREVLRRLLPIPESMRIQADGFVELVAILLAPVHALTEPLAVYRIHGKNLCYQDWAESTPEAMQRRAASYLTVLREIRAWIRRHKSELRGIDTRHYLVAQYFEMQEIHFLTAPPSRARSFWFLLKRDYAFGRLHSWRYRILNHLIACLALAFGYRTARSMHRKTLESLQAILKRA